MAMMLMRMRMFVIMVVTAAAFFAGVFVRVIMATVFMMNMSMTVGMIVIMAAAALMAVFVSMVVTVIMTAAAMTALVRMIVTATAFAMVMAVTTGDFRVHGEEIESSHDRQTDACDQNHRAKDTVSGQVLVHTSGEVEIQEHGAPEEEQRNADQVDDGAGSTHGFGVAV